MAENTQYFQPIIRGIQNVGSVQILYRYNKLVGESTSAHYVLPIPPSNAIRLPGVSKAKEIDCQTIGIPVAGFRLDSEFLRANPQIASSFTIPILGGGGVSLTNNNRTGTLNLVCARVSAPRHTGDEESANLGAMINDGQFGGNGIGVMSATDYWDFVTLAQIQQAQEGGDSYGAQITIIFAFCGVVTTVTFEGCTIATVDPLGLAGNDAVNYGIAVNYLNWKLEYQSDNAQYAGESKSEA